jgi:hypothetical protein
MSKCWAAPIGNCAEGISREHYVSEAFFSAPAVAIHGLPWCKDEPKVVGISAATAKILCRKHNSDLSPLDEAAGRFMAVIREHLRLSEVRPKRPASPLKIERLTTDARLLERWLLKCMLNLLAGGTYLIGPKGIKPGEPPLDLVRVAYGQDAFEGRSGMHVGAHRGLDLQMGEMLQFSPLLLDDQRVVAGLFRVAGFQLYLSLDPAGVTSSLQGVSGLDQAWRLTELKRPFKKVVVKHGKYISHTIEFLWPY